MTVDTASVFVTSTGTEIGKTVVSLLFVRQLRREGMNTGYYKPVASGCERGAFGYRSPDEVDVLRETGLEPEDVHAHYRFDAPLSPDRAAALEGDEIALEGVLDTWRELRARYDALVVEGIGGVAVPFSPKTDVTDLASRLNLPLALVVSSGLGTISHTRTAVTYLRQAGVHTHGVMLTPGRGEDIEITNRDHLREIYPDRPVELLPRFDPGAPDGGRAGSVAKQFLRGLGVIQ